MHIHCPECDFSREVNESQIPANSFFATCPKCGTRFRFRAQTPEAEVAAPEIQPKSAAPQEQAPDAPNDDENMDIWSRMEKMNDKWEGSSGSKSAPDDSEADAEPKRRKPDEPGYFGSAQTDEERQAEAHRAYQRAAAQSGRAPLYSPGGSVPWECKGGFMRLKGFAATVVLAFKETRRFFAGINPFSSIVPAWAYVMLCYVPTFLMMTMYYKNVIPLINGGQEEVAASAMGYMAFLFNSLFLFTFFQFIGSVFVYFTLRIIEPRKAIFRMAFKVVAYAQTSMLLMVLPVIGGIAGFGLFIFLLVLGTRNAFRLELKQAAITVTPFLIFIAFIMVQSFRLALSLLQGAPV